MTHRQSHIITSFAVLALALTAMPALANQQSSWRNSTDWSGPYVGGHLGGGWADFSNDGGIGPSGSEESLLGGVQAGHNWQRDRYVFGVEGDFTKMNLQSKNAASNVDEDWMMSFRGRAGYDFGQFLPYVTAGLGLTDVVAKVPGGEETYVQPGPVVGAGVDSPVSDNWFGRVEYLYSNVPEDSTNIGGSTVTAGSDNHIVRVGLNYKF